MFQTAALQVVLELPGDIARQGRALFGHEPGKHRVMALDQLVQQGLLRTEMPGCSLCMGNQARVAANSTVLSTSTRNFPNRLGDGANVYLTSAELASVGAILGKLPTPEEYLKYASELDSMSDEIYRYMNFDQILEIQKSAEEGQPAALSEVIAQWPPTMMVSTLHITTARFTYSKYKRPVGSRFPD